MSYCYNRILSRDAAYLMFVLSANLLSFRNTDNLETEGQGRRVEINLDSSDLALYLIHEATIMIGVTKQIAELFIAKGN